MTRITTKQNKIFKAYLTAYKTDNFKVDTSAITLKHLSEEGNTNKQVWRAIFEPYITIKSQLMASNETFQYLSDKAIKDLRRGFKNELNYYNIK